MQSLIFVVTVVMNNNVDCMLFLFVLFNFLSHNWLNFDHLF